MDDYYSHHAIRVPRIPITLIGFMGSMPEIVGSSISQFTGVGFVDVNRAIEHRVGTSIARLVTEHGQDRLRATEAECTRTALRARPPAIIALGDSVADDPDTLDRVTSESALVYLRMDADDLCRRIVERRRQFPAAFYPWIPVNESVRLEQVSVLLAERERAFEHAVLRVEAGAGRSLDQVGTEIIEHFALTP